MPLEYLRSCAEDDALFTMIVRSSDQNRIGSAKATYAKEDVFWHLETFPSLDIPSGAMNGQVYKILLLGSQGGQLDHLQTVRRLPQTR